MLTIINAVRLALGIVPELIALIKAVELSGNGAAKATAVAELVKAALNLVPEELVKIVHIDKIDGFVRRAIDVVVGLLNAAGAFKKSASAPSAG